ncbi:MAG: ribonuclease E inhibitor RraB [Tepidisphaeraceae bacterium]
MYDDFPNDADGDAIRRVAEAGHDLRSSMPVDFRILVADENAARAIAIEAQDRAFSAAIGPAETGGWQVIVTRSMLLRYWDVVQLQKDLNDLAEPFEGYCDAWATVGNRGAAEE